MEAAHDWSPDLCDLITLIPVPCCSYHLAQLLSRYWHCPLLGHLIDKSLLQRHVAGPSSEQVKSIEAPLFSISQVIVSALDFSLAVLERHW